MKKKKSIWVAGIAIVSAMGGVWVGTSGADPDPAPPSADARLTASVIDVNGNELVCGGHVVTAAEATAAPIVNSPINPGSPGREAGPEVVAPVEPYAGPWFSFACVNDQVVAVPGP